MLYFLNKPLILEQSIKKAFEDYFKTLRSNDYYKNWNIRVTNEHPFALMLPDFKYNASLFPVIVISTESDGKPSELSNLAETQTLMLDKSDVPLLKKTGYMVCDELIEDLQKEMVQKEHLYGITYIVRRKEKITVEIWSENIQLKNELYELCRLFLAGGIHEAMEAECNNNNLVIFDHTITGDRSGNYNYDFGTTLAGARLSFDADYFIEQSIIDTKINGKKKIIWEVIDNVKRS